MFEDTSIQEIQKYPKMLEKFSIEEVRRTFDQRNPKKMKIGSSFGSPFSSLIYSFRVHFIHRQMDGQKVRTIAHLFHFR